MGVAMSQYKREQEALKDEKKKVQKLEEKLSISEQEEIVIKEEMQEKDEKIRKLSEKNLELEKQNKEWKESETQRKTEEEERNKQKKQTEEEIRKKIAESENLLDEEFKNTLSVELPKEEIALLIQIFRKERERIKLNSADVTWNWQEGTLKREFKENRRYENTEEYIAKVSKRLSDDDPELGSDEYCEESDEAEMKKAETLVENYFQKQMETVKELDQKRVHDLNALLQENEMHQKLEEMHSHLIEEINAINTGYKDRITDCVKRGTKNIRSTLNEFHQEQKEKLISIDGKRVQKIETNGINRIILEPGSGDQIFADKIIEIKKVNAIDKDTLRAFATDVLKLVREESEKSVASPFNVDLMRRTLANFERQSQVIDPKIDEGKERGSRTEKNIREELQQQRQSFSFADSIRP